MERIAFSHLLAMDDSFKWFGKTHERVDVQTVHAFSQDIEIIRNGKDMK